MMKRMFLFVLALVCAVSLCACGDNGQSDIIVDGGFNGQSYVVLNKSESTESVAVSVTDVSDILDTDIIPTGDLSEFQTPLPEFVYNMSEIYKASSNSDYYEKLWFVIEFQTLGYKATDFRFKNKTTGESISDGMYMNADISVYNGCVCSEPHANNFITDTGLDYQQYIICIAYSGSIDFSDLEVRCDLLYDDRVSSEQILEFNANISDITTRQTYLHGETLFELDGNYYIHEPSTGLYSDLNGTYEAETYSIHCINGTLEDLVRSLSNNVKFVYGPVYDRSEYDNTGYGPDADYMYHMEIPVDCEMYLDADMDLLVGFRGVDGHVLTDSDIARVHVINMRYYFADGQTMTFVAF